MSSVECLRVFVNERLTAAAEEIFRVFKKTIVEYEEELDRQRTLLNMFWKPDLTLGRTDLPQQRRVCNKEEGLADQQLCNQEMNSSLNQEDPEPPQIKEEQEEVCTSDEGQQLVLKQETETFMLTPTYEESSHSEPEPKSDHQLFSNNSRVTESKDQKRALPMCRVITFSNFLHEHGVPEEVISRLEEEKVGKDVVPFMENGNLAKCISSYGDRLALMNFCKNQTPLQKHRMGLFEKLRTTLQMRKEAYANVSNIESQTPAKKRGRASHRKIEIGWLHSENGQVKQMRTKQGGGTRTAVVGVDCGMDTVLEMGKNFFFPEGMSTKGHETHFKFEVWDYKRNPVCEDVTIGFIYNTLSMARLRFYIATCPKENLQNDRTTDNTETEDDEEAEAIHGDDEDGVRGNPQLYADNIARESADDGQEEDNFPVDEQDDNMEGCTLDNSSLSVVDSHGVSGAHFITDHYCTVADTMLHNIPNTDFTPDVSDYELTFGPLSSEHASDDNDTEPCDVEITL